MAKTMSLSKRWKAKTPKFFKRVIAILLSISGIGAVGVGIIEGFNQAGIVVPAWLNTVSVVLISVGIVTGVVAKFAAEIDIELDNE